MSERHRANHQHLSPAPLPAATAPATGRQINAVVNPRILTATTGRILRQLRHDPRTIGLLIGVPVVLMGLVYAMYDGSPQVGQILLIMLGIFPFVIMFLITSIAMLRERTSGTLERLMTTRTGKGDLLFGYGIAFGTTAAGQAVVAAACAYWLYSMITAGSAGLVVLIAVLTALLGVGLGLACSALARTEFQAVQMLPVVVIPQILLCGLFVPRDEMAGWLSALSDVMPLSYAVEALQEVGANSEPTSTFWIDLVVVGGCVILGLILAAVTLRRRTP
ncbi:ABC transporter permease [Nakamurella sp.]|uniref:ABC transporter permease n=1 Tax=Nakamurella sp. TaxID=1869182 RepID=UPI003782DD74